MLHTGQDLISSAGGSVAIAGTVAVNLPAIAATTPFYSTVVTMVNITPNHSIQMFDMGTVSGASANATPSTARILFSIQPQQGQVTMSFLNTGATVNASDKVYSYVATLNR